FQWLTDRRASYSSAAASQKSSGRKNLRTSESSHARAKAEIVMPTSQAISISIRNFLIFFCASPRGNRQQEFVDRVRLIAPLTSARRIGTIMNISSDCSEGTPDGIAS